MKTKFGWRRNLAYGEKINKRSLFNNVTFSNLKGPDDDIKKELLIFAIQNHKY